MIGHENTRFHVNMTLGRMFAASIVVGNRLWVLGGFGKFAAATSSEYVSIIDGIHPERGPDLPIPLFHHTVVSINETTAMLIGGYNMDVSYKTYYFYYLNNDWTQGPDLDKSGSIIYHNAGIITDHITQEDHLLVFGIGIFDPFNTSSVILEINEWHSGTVTMG